MGCWPSTSDVRFRNNFESGRISIDEFSDRNQLRLAYVYLSDNDVAHAFALMKSSLFSFLNSKRVDSAEYCDTLSLTWFQAVLYFMQRSGDSQSFVEFLESDARLIDKEEMLNVYSEGRLVTNSSFEDYGPADKQPIPLY